MGYCPLSHAGELIDDGRFITTVVLLPIDLLAHQIASPEASGQQRLGEVSGRLAPCALRCIAHNKHCPSRAPFHYDLAELQADMAFETYLSAFEVGDHPEVIDSLATEALIAQDRCADLRSQDLAH